MEMVDVFTRDDVFTGITMPKHAPMKPGQYFRHAVIIMKTCEGYIMQQRSLLARHCPGKWDVTGGGVMAGETPAQAACREAMEELGVEIPVESVRLFHKEIMMWGENVGATLYVFAARVNVPEGGFRIDSREVNGVKVVPYGEFCENIRYNKTAEFMGAMARIEEEI